jgi:hypothetical protein
MCIPLAGKSGIPRQAIVQTAGGRVEASQLTSSIGVRMIRQPFPLGHIVFGGLLMFRTVHRRSISHLAIAAGLVLAGGACLLVLASCTQSQSRERAMVLPPTTRPVLHAVYADDLRQAMRDLNTQAEQQVWLQMYNTTEPQVDMSQMIDVADKMANVAANRLPQVVNNVQMDANERQIFLGLSQRLADQAVVLKQQAQADQLTRAQSTMNDIINTCNTCHTMFRNVAGPL